MSKLGLFHYKDKIHNVVLQEPKPLVNSILNLAGP